MATFDELRASRNDLAQRIDKLRGELCRIDMLLAQAEWGQDLRPEIALLLQELNAELKRDNDEAEANQK